MTWLLYGDAVTTDEAVTAGGGTGLSVRKSGWMCDCDIAGLSLLSLAAMVEAPLRTEFIEKAVGGRCICEGTERDERAVDGLSIRSCEGVERSDG